MSAASDKTDVIDTLEAAKMLGFSRSYVSIMISYLPHFPRPFKIKGQGNKSFFKRNALLAFCKKYDAREELRKIWCPKKAREAKLIDPTDIAQQLRLNFLRGEYAPPAVKQQLALKKLAAKHNQPAPTKRISVGFKL